MNAHGRALRTTRIVGALAGLLLAHSASADDTMTVYGKRMVKPDASLLAQSAVDTAGILVALQDDLRASIHAEIRSSIRDGFNALRVEITKDQDEAIEVKVAALTTRAGV